MGELDRYKSGPTWTVKNGWLDKSMKTKNNTGAGKFLTSVSDIQKPTNLLPLPVRKSYSSFTEVSVPAQLKSCNA